MAVTVPLACAALGIVANVVSDQDTRIGLLMWAGFLCVLSIGFLLCLSIRYRVTHDGLFVCGIRKEEFFPWHTLTLIGLRRNAVDGTLDSLRVSAGRRSIQFASGGLDQNFAILAQEILRRTVPGTAQCVAPAALPVQIRNRASRWLMVVVVLMFLSMSIALAVFSIRDSFVFGLFVAPMGLSPIAFGLWADRRTIHGIAADSDGVTLQLGFSTRRIPWDRLVIHRLVQSNPDEPISQMHIQIGSGNYVIDPSLVNAAAFQPIAKLLIQRGRLHRWNEISSDAESFVRLSRWYLFPQLWVLFVVFAGLAWLFSYFELPRETWLGVAFCCSALLACVVYTFVHSISTLHATAEGLHIAAPFRRTFIPWDQLHVTQCHRESPEGKIISIRFGTPPKLWSLNLFRNKSPQLQTICNIILTRAAHSPPSSHGHRDPNSSM